MSNASRIPRHVAVAACLVVLALPLHAEASLVSDAVANGGGHGKKACPLTGKKARRATVRRPAVAVKVDNSAAARPQAGLDEADVVIESLVEGGMTRLSAVFHCGQAPSVGPVRSARFDDAYTVDPFTSFLAMSGSNEAVAENLDLAGFTAIDEEGAADAMSRDENLEAPYDLFADTEALRSLAPEDVEPPSVMNFDTMPSGAVKAKGVDITFSEATTVSYEWTKQGWARSQDGEPFMSGAHRVYAQNVLVQVVDVMESDTLGDENGVPSPTMSLEGKGTAYLFRNGRVVVGKWSDDGDGPPVFRTAKGKRFAFATGTTWYEVVPSADGDLAGDLAFR